jgi:predicted RNA-binding protein YlxR (DUF448 family)/ribosomal protein L7Ae-like RNA K-turn-binding protein
MQDDETTQGSMRTCVTCRQTRPQDELLRLGVASGVVCVGRPGKGRSAYVCIDRQCMSHLAIKNLAQTLRCQVRFPDASLLAPNRSDTSGPAVLMALVHMMAERRVLEVLGLARRSGELVIGSDHVEATDTGVVILATDLSARTIRHTADGFQFLDCAAIGRALGLDRVGVAQIPGGRLARNARYWLNVWRETRETEDVRPAGPADSSGVLACGGFHTTVAGRSPLSGQGPSEPRTANARGA